jgi:hypothetical protein
MATKRQRRKRRRRAAGDSARGVQEGPAVAATDAPPTRSSSARRTDGPPPAPWGSFPLSELVVLVALVMLVAGFFVEPPRGAILIGTGLALGSLAGLELAVREHFSGYRSHTLLLGGAIGVAVLTGLVVSGATTPAVSGAVGAVAFVVAAWGFAMLFRRRSGGELFRFKGR